MPALPDLAATMRALAFLSRVQVPDRFFDGAGHHRTADDAAAFPLAGLIIALPGAATIAVASLMGAPALLAAAMAVTLTIVLTGALHEDGLADAADGFGGGHDIDRRLEIMRDSRVGTYGVLALIAGFALRVIALAAILDAAGWLAAGAAWIASNAASRSALVWLWSNLPTAREDGLSANAGQPDQGTARMTMIVGGVIAAALGVLAIGLWPTGLAAIFALAAVWAFAKLARRMIGGQTGDTLGAAEQIAQIAVLCGLAMLP